MSDNNIEGHAMKIRWILCFICTCLQAEETVESPCHIQEINQEFSLIDQRWDLFKDRLNWFFEYTAVKVECDPNDDMEVWLKGKCEKEHERLKESVMHLSDEFLEFRMKTAQVFEGRFHPASYSRTIYANTCQDLTEWYVNYIEANLFPADWKSLYEQYVHEKERTTKNNPEH